MVCGSCKREGESRGNLANQSSSAQAGEAHRQQAALGSLRQHRLQSPVLETATAPTWRVVSGRQCLSGSPAHVARSLMCRCIGHCHACVFLIQMGNTHTDGLGVGRAWRVGLCRSSHGRGRKLEGKLAQCQQQPPDRLALSPPDLVSFLPTRWNAVQTGFTRTCGGGWRWTAVHPSCLDRLEVQ
ncbi:hypothetical protein K431DRAFT_120256 [Polychaeton citri CBS 116435]|uniref:Uncharacterized protein n=1 Tax=Polychaeton citri CBS 116435 TaxID=1314669 RepID=A0A9P4Q468_9PEZI|nr:hypothetical protein K431DRAFT_120256 [Polychaeton citri CBS 116435]